MRNNKKVYRAVLLSFALIVYSCEEKETVEDDGGGSVQFEIINQSGKDIYRIGLHIERHLGPSIGKIIRNGETSTFTVTRKTLNSFYNKTWEEFSTQGTGGVAQFYDENAELIAHTVDSILLISDGKTTTIEVRPAGARMTAKGPH
ncbi:MAG: hypothetical protein LBG74_03540 [Spirochaetaceae bacterium]|nr:hypothetical protein [Spirochaetaceae bacterium]